MGERPQPPGPDPTVRTARSTRDPHLRPRWGHHLGQQVTPGDVHDHGTGDYRRNPATEAIHHPGHDEHPDRRRHRTADRADGADSPPRMIGIRRPRWSDSGPPSICPNPIPKKKVVNVSPFSDRRGQVGRHPRERRGVHVRRERRDSALQSQRHHQRRGHRRTPGNPPAADREWERSHRQATSGSRKDHDLPGRANPLQVVVRVGAPVDFEDPVQRDQLRVRSRRRKVVRHRGRQIRTFRGVCRDPHRLSASSRRCRVCRDNGVSGS